MQLEAGKYYRTRDGRKAFVGYVQTDIDNRSFFGHIVIDQHKYQPHCWFENGGGRSHPDRSDLVEEWREPVTREVFLLRSQYSGDTVVAGHEGQRGWEVIAKFTITEGEGMTDD